MDTAVAAAGDIADVPLFRPLQMRGLKVANRIAVAPMCQYSAIGGLANEWHLQHLMSLSMSGAGLVVIEATDVDPAGALTQGCLGLHSDEHERALAHVVQACHCHGAAAIGLQLTHSGRKAACNVPWVRAGRPLSDQEGAWQPCAPSPIPYGTGWQTPAALDATGLKRIRDAFAQAAQRATRIGIDSLELHAAHGYLLHQFLAPASNQRSDAYGGSRENRMRFPLEVFEAVREAWPSRRPLGVRISGEDWAEQGVTPQDAVVFARELELRGCDFVCISSGGLVPGAAIKVGPGYQVPLAAAVKSETNLIVRTVGLISDARQANGILAAGHADVVALARAFLDDPRWGWHAAAELGVNVAYPPQYERCHPSLWAGSRHFVAGDAYHNANRFMPRGLGS